MPRSIGELVMITRALGGCWISIDDYNFMKICCDEGLGITRESTLMLEVEGVDML